MFETSPPSFTLLQVCPALDAGGVEQTTLDVARAVTAAGGRALVASAGGRMEAALTAAGGELLRMPLDAKAPWTMLANARRLAAAIRSEGVDVIHARSRAPAYSAWLAARLTRAAFVTTYHGTYNARSAPKRWYNKVMARGDAVIANSGFTHDHLLTEHPGVDPARVITIPRGVEIALFDPDSVAPDRIEAVLAGWGLQADPGRPVILAPARLTRWKGQALLIQALAALARGGQGDWTAILAGDDQGRSAYRDELAALIMEADLQDRVRIVGHCTDMPAAYLAADLVAAPSLEPEAFGRTAVEPQLMGRPVLAADHGAVRETVEDGVGGWRVAPGSVPAWTRALAQALATPPEVRAAMGAAGRERARRLYALDAMTDATLAVYAELLDARRR